MRIGRALWVAGLITLLGCAPDAPGSATGAPSSVLPIAGDGGVECAHPEEGCACDPGQPEIDCFLDPIDNGDGTLTCNHGTRYCRDGLWTGCEAIREYVVGGTGAALIGTPTACNPCNPLCFVTRDTPNDGDLTSGNSSSVSYDSGRGGITLTPTTPVPEPLTDTDGDGVPDVADECVGPGAFRNADGTCYGDRFLYHTLPLGTEAIDPLDIRTQIRTADVYFLMDTTGSMGGELDRLQNDLTSGSFISGCGGGVMGAIRCTIPDAWFGVGYFDDYPYGSYGGSGDRVYRNVRDIDGSLPGAQSAMNGLSIHWGNDGPESNTQALWAVATGGGLGSYLSARSGCPAGRWGYPCFRDGTIPIVIHITDAPFHNGPGDAYPYCIGSWDSRSVPSSGGTAVSGNERMDGSAHGVVNIGPSTWVSFTGNTSSMANDVDFGCGEGSRDAVFRVRLTQTLSVRFTTDNSTYDTVLGVFPVSGGRGWCNDDGGSGNRSRLDLTLGPGDYWVVVDGYGSSSGAYRLTMGVVSYCDGYTGASWDDTVSALASRQIRVITMQTCGSWSNSYCLEGEDHAEALGNATGSTGSAGTPYVFRGSSSGSGLSSAIVDAVVDLANYSRMDVSARAVGDTQGFTRLPITALSWGPRGSCTGISGGNTFVQCLPGTDVNFRVTFRNDAVMPMATPQVFTFFIEIVGDGTIVLGRVPVRIVVPAISAGYPATGTYLHDYDTTTRCDLTERPDWGNLTWSADVPAGTSLEFELRAAESLAALPTATPVARITVPSATSPRDIAAVLRAAGYPDGRRFLRVTAVLHANSTRTASPALREMSVTYTCIPAE